MNAVREAKTNEPARASRTSDAVLVQESAMVSHTAGTASKDSGKHTGMRYIMLVLLAMASVIGAIGAMGVGPVEASGTGCTWYGTTIRYGVRNGSFCGSVNGSGTYVSTVTGNFGQTVPGLDTKCNVNIKVDFYDTSGRWYAWRNGAVMYGCFWGAFNWAPTIPVYSGVRAGYARITLQSNGQYIAAVQLNIY